MSSPCHIELVLSEKEAPVKKEVGMPSFCEHLQRVEPVGNNVTVEESGPVVNLSVVFLLHKPSVILHQSIFNLCGQSRSSPLCRKLWALSLL